MCVKESIDAFRSPAIFAIMLLVLRCRLDLYADLFRSFSAGDRFAGLSAS